MIAARGVFGEGFCPYENNRFSRRFVIFSGVSLAQAPAPNNSAAPKPASQTQMPQNQIMTVDEVRPGMKGVAYTVFWAPEPEAIGVEVRAYSKT